jgi:hypothetical protein
MTTSNQSIDSVIEQPKECIHVQQIVVLGEERFCDASLTAPGFKWCCTQNWIHTNVANPTVVAVLSKRDASVLNTIFQSLWPIYDDSLITSSNILELIHVACICGVNHFIKNAIIHVNRDHIEHILNKSMTDITATFKCLDDHRQNEHVMNQLYMLIEDCYARRYIDEYHPEEDNLIHFLFDYIDITCLSKETICNILTHMNRLHTHNNSTYP